MTITALKKPPSRHELTFEEYEALPETMLRYEIIEGVMTMSPAPNFYHQFLIGQIFSLLRDFVLSMQFGQVFCAPADIVIRRKPKLVTRQPDVFYIRREKLGPKPIATIKKMDRAEFAPDLAVEILSPKEDRTRKKEKLSDYAEIGVDEVWMVSPEAKTVEVLNLNKGEYVRSGLFGTGDEVLSPILPGMRIAMDAIFEEDK